MRQRLVLLIFGLLALGWVVFSSYDLLSNENLVDFRTYFNTKDQTVYIIQDPQALDWENERMVTTELNQSLYYTIIKRAKEPITLFFSAKSTKILIEKKGNWTQKDIKDLFANGLFPLQLGQLKQFEFGQLHGKYNRNQLLLYAGELPLAEPLRINVSTKASYAWINWVQGKQLRLTETYCKKDARYRYIKYKNPNPKLRKLNDQALFADVIPDFFKRYYFYEKSYAQQIDPSFAKSPWFRCIDHGFVHLKQDSASLVIFDFQENSNPIQTLNEYFRKEELNTESASYDQIKFSELISSEKTTWHLAVSGQYAFASPSFAQPSTGRSKSRTDPFSRRNPLE